MGFHSGELRPIGRIESGDHVQLILIAPDGRTVARLWNKISQIAYHFIFVELIDLIPKPVLGEQPRFINTGWNPMTEEQVEFYGLGTDQNVTIGVPDKEQHYIK